MFQVLSLILPILISGVFMIFTIKLRALSFLNYPIDLNLKLKSKNIFGKNKTFRGFSILIFFSIISCNFLHFIYTNTETNLIHKVFSEDPYSLGLLFGVSYEFGELLNSFVKRRIGIAPGVIKGKIQYFFDLSDGVITTAFILLVLNKISTHEVLFAAFLGITVHLFTDKIMVQLKLKKIF